MKDTKEWENEEIINMMGRRIVNMNRNSYGMNAINMKIWVRKWKLHKVGKKKDFERNCRKKNIYI